MEEDFKAMRDAQLSVIRVGESVWSTWEPALVRLLDSNEIIELGPWDVTIARDI